MTRIGLALALHLLLAGCRGTAPLPVLGVVPEFRMIDQRDQVFESRSLAGKMWVADFFFTRCTGPCPRMSAQMRQIQMQTRDLPDLRLLSFSVDPERDSPQVLAEYARRFQAEPGRWFLLTGPAAELNRLSLTTFNLGQVDGRNLEHSTRFVLVDGQSRIRGYYLSSEIDFIQTVVQAVRRLAKEPAR